MDVSSGRGSVRTCKKCGKEFKGRVRRDRPSAYCSKECMWQAQKKREDRVCLQCGKAFHPHNMAKGLYCSHECSGIALRTNACAVCGKWVPSGRRFCSEECRGAKDAKDAWDRIGYERQFDDMVKWMGRLSSRVRECESCGRTFYTAKPNQVCCSQGCSRRRDNTRRDSRIYRNGPPDLSVTLDKLFVRDGGRCVRCGLPMTFDCDPNSNDYPSIDHIVPLARGGLHQWSNVQLMCRGCNSDKRASIEGGGPRPAWF